MREPPPTLALVDAERLEPLVKILGQGRRAVVVVVECEHPHAARLAVAADREPRPLGTGGRSPQGADDRFQLRRRPVAQECEGDVQVLAGDRSDARYRGERLPLPCEEPVERLLGKLQGAEEASALIAFEASRRIRTQAS